MDTMILETRPPKSIPSRPGKGLQAWTIRALRAAQAVHAARVRLPVDDPRRLRLERAGKVLAAMVAQAEGRQS